MPAFELKTNVKLDDPKEFVKDFSQFASTLLDKPLPYVTVSYNYNEFMAWEGSFEPAFLLNVTSLDNMDDPDQNEEFSKALFMYVETKLGAKDHRGYIVFNDPGRVHIGYQSTTMHVIFGPKEETTEQQ